MSQENIPPGLQAHCQFCGGKLDVRLGAGNGKPNSAETTCTVCGREDGFGWTTFGPGQSDPAIAKRFRNPFSRQSCRKFPRYMSPDGAPDIRLIIEDAEFPVYGLKGRPNDLRLKSIGGRSESNIETMTEVSFVYRVGHPSNPDAALGLTESTREPYRDVKEGYLEVVRAELEFHAVEATVRNNVSTEQTKRWFYDGDFNRIWNMDRAADTIHKSIEIEIAEAMRSAVVASWEEPFKVMVFTFTLPPVHITVCSLNLSQQDTVDSLKHLAAMQGADAMFADHQEDMTETRKLLWPDR